MIVNPWSLGFAVLAYQLDPGTLEGVEQVIKVGIAGLSFAHVVRTTVFLADMNDFAAVNEVYASYFGDPKPARVTVQAARLPREARIEIDAIASYDV